MIPIDRLVIFGVLLGAFAASLLTASTARAEHRVALVIGNQRYESLPSLEKSAADAAAYASLFKSKGFDQVIFKEDLSRNGMDQAVSQFIDAVQSGDLAVFVYAGHGWSDGSQNYLVPTDAPRSGSEGYLKRISLPIENGVDGVLDEIERKGARLKVAIIDACRNNPFISSDGTRSVGMSRGFNRMPQPPAGTFVVFSAGAGQTALDWLSDADPNPNGVFTRTFVPLLDADLTLLDATKAAQEKVYEAAKSVGHDQQPAYYDETRGNRACLSEACSESSGGTIAIDYQLAEKIGTSNAWNVFLAKYGEQPGNFYVLLAEAALKQLAPSRRLAPQVASPAAVPVAPTSPPNPTQLMATSAASLLPAFGPRPSTDMVATPVSASPPVSDALSTPPGPEAPAPALQPRPLPQPDRMQIASLPPSMTVSPYGYESPVDHVPPSNEMPVAAPSSKMTELTPQTMDVAKLTRDLQSELQRVGCYAGTIDGNWGARSQTGVADFGKKVSLDVPGGSPSGRPQDYVPVLNRLHAYSGTACVPSCGTDQQLMNGHCVAKTCLGGQALGPDGSCKTKTAISASQPGSGIPTAPDTGTTGGRSLVEKQALSAKVQSQNCFMFNNQLVCE